MAERKPLMIGPVSKEQKLRDLRRRTSSARLTKPTGNEREIREPAFLSRVRSLPELFAELGLLPSINDASPAGKVASLAVTPFVRAGVPLKALREQYTTKLLGQAQEIFPEHLHTELKELIERFPRVSAATTLSNRPAPPLGEASVLGETRWAPVERIPIKGADASQIPVELFGKPTLDTLVHELGHVAQALGNRHAPELYGLLQRSAPSDTAYRLNAFERSARNIAARKVGDEITDPIPAMRELASQFPRRRPGDDITARIRAILEQRRK